MTIIFSSAQADISSGDGLGGALGELGEAMGIPGLVDPRGKPPRSRSAVFDEAKETAGRLLDALRGKGSTETYDQHFVGSGRQVIPGGQIQGGKASPLESASVRRTTSQAPNVSVLVKKRAFASLNHYYTPALMDDDELWLFRATKRLFQRKCQEISDYERISKIKKMADNEASAQAALLSLTTFFGAQLHEAALDSAGAGGDSFSGFFTSAQRLEQAARDREPRDVTTWFSDPDLPILSELGQGSGVFEITLASSINTNLSISGSGNCSISLENPYNILMVTEYDIEQAIRDTALTNLVEALGAAASTALQAAQRADAELAKSRRENLRSAISFNVSPAGNAPVTAIIDAIGFQITPDNLDVVPEGYELDASEQNLFKRAYRNLGNYSKAVQKQRLRGLTAGGQAASLGLRNTMDYVRRMMRKFYMGKLVIQPMDTVNIFIHGNTRLPGEGMEPTPDRNPLSSEGIVRNAVSLLGLGDSQSVDDRLLKVAWERSGQYMRFSDFKKLNTIERGGIHVFAGLVRQSSSRYNAEQGKYEVSVSADSNMEWLKLSRYNKEPSLNQTQGIVYDPLTPFKLKTDPATGIPAGEVELTDVNKRILAARPLYQQRGRRRGERMRTTQDLQQDGILAGGTLTPVYEMPPGLKYRWKEGIITVTYDLSTTDPLDKTKVKAEQLRRDIGFFASNTVWDNMDAANIISTLVTGQPYNVVTFIQSATNTGAFARDTALNDWKNYFHSLLPVQQSLNRVQGNFSPFKHINTDRTLLARALSTQQRLKDKSSRLQQLRSQDAKLQDDLLNLEQSFSLGSGQQKPPEYTAAKAAFTTQKTALQSELLQADKEFSDLFKDAKENVGSVMRIAGDDITFSFSDPKSEEEAQLFGDKLTFVTQRRREDVMYNRDQSYLIVSEEYDKDYDIQAFALQMRRQGPNMWKSSWEDPYQICKRAADMLDFEFFVNTQGHIEFRPPQYNRTPLAVMRAMLALNKTAGIKTFPDFLEKLFSSREKSLINDILAIEWEMRRQMALLGYADPNDFAIITGADIQFLHTAEDIGQTLSKERSQTLSMTEKQNLRAYLSLVEGGSNTSTGMGIFVAKQQLDAQQKFIGQLRVLGSQGVSSEEAYSKAIDELVGLTGKLRSSYPSFEEAKVGARKNGRSTPASDIAGIISSMGNLVSQRSRLVQTLDSVLSQSVEVAKLNEDGTIDFGIGSLTTKMFPAGFYDKLIEDDTQHVLGHMSGRRFIIDDDVLLGYSFTESPPGTTHWGVAGTDPIVGERGGNAFGGFPLYLAIGVDFDLVRQYGFRSEKTVDKPMFWDAEKQCAPYAKMLLTRERKDLVKVNAQVIGNEYYQLGDVVYLSDLQMLFYVYGVSHSFTYENGFSTSLDLRYGHPPGEYIPTPLDVMGKGLSNRAGSQVAYRTRRQQPASDTILGVVKFPQDKSDMESLLNSSHGRRNLDQLQRAVANALTEIDASDTASDTTPHVVVMAFGDSSNKSVQEQRISAVKNWLSRPRMGGAASDSMSAGVPIKTTTSNKDLASKFIPSKLIDEERLAQLLPLEQMSSSDKQLLKAGIVASGDAWLLDETLDTVVEIRLRRAPPKGWSGS